MRRRLSRGVPAVLLVLLLALGWSCDAGEMAADAMVDAGERLRDAMSDDASAQDAAVPGPAFETFEVPCDVERVETQVIEIASLRTAWTHRYAVASDSSGRAVLAVTAYACGWDILGPPQCTGGAPCVGEPPFAPTCKSVTVELDDGVIRAQCGTTVDEQRQRTDGSWSDPSPRGELATTARITVFRAP